MICNFFLNTEDFLNFDSFIHLIFEERHVLFLFQRRRYLEKKNQSPNISQIDTFKDLILN